MKMTTESESYVEDANFGPEMEEFLKKLHKLYKYVAAKDVDAMFVQELMKNPIMQSLAKAHNAFEDRKIKATSMTSYTLCHNVVELLDEMTNDSDLEELSNILRKPHVKNLLKAHDTVARNEEEREQIQLHGTVPNVAESKPEVQCTHGKHRAIRMVGLTKKAWEPLGLTVVKKNGELVIARILHGSDIERKGLLHVDDIIKEVNGCTMDGDPKKLQDYLSRKTGSLVFKIIPSYAESPSPQMVYVKCHMDYDPKSDDQIPCKDAGLSFKKGNILLVVDQKEENWWQARHVNSKGEARGLAGLIPSQAYEERRKAATDMKSTSVLEKKKSKKRKSQRKMYSAAQNAAFDKHDIAVYEEVMHISPIMRKTLVFLVQSKSLADDICQEVLEANSELYGRPEKYEPNLSTSEDSKGSTEANQEEELHSKAEPSDGFFGTRLDSIRNVIKEGKTCVLSVPPQALKILKTSEFMPYVVFIKLAEEGRKMSEDDKIFNISETDVEKYYSQYVDDVTTLTTSKEVATTIMEKLEKLKTKHQWVPTSWVY